MAAHLAGPPYKECWRQVLPLPKTRAADRAFTLILPLFHTPQPEQQQDTVVGALRAILG